jgi:serine O-acetyltransferase
MFQQLREDIQAILVRDPAAKSAWEVLTCYPGLHAITLHRIGHVLWRKDWRWLARWLSNWSRWLTGIEIHPGATIGRRVFIDHGMGIVVGETAEIGDDCTLYQGVTLGGTSLNGGKRHPTLGRGVIIGAGAKVLGGFTVGDGAKVGSNAVVVREVPAGATAVGNPARIVEPGAQKAEHARAQKAESMGFSAYGVTRDVDDPVAKAIHALLDHAVETDRRLSLALKHMEAAGIRCDDVTSTQDGFDAKYISKIVD